MVKAQFKLLLFFISYLYFGAMFFYLVEPKHEKLLHDQKLIDRIELYKVMSKYLAPDNPQLRAEILANASNYCGHPMTLPDPHEVEYRTWTFYHCLFFAMTIITTVGYGNIIPQTLFGRLFVIFYALVGLPLNGIMFARFGQVYWDMFDHMHDRFKKFSHKIRLMLVIKWLIFLFPGFLFFILLPAIVFTYFEKWSYGISIYYAFVTLTTIGFGDYAATFENESATEIDDWYYCYQVFVLIWFVLGLGYMIMITQYLIGHYEKSHFNQMDFHQTMSIEEEMVKFGRNFKEDIKSVNQTIISVSRCFYRTCDCKRRTIPEEHESSQVTPPPPPPPTNVTLKRAMSSPAF